MPSSNQSTYLCWFLCVFSQLLLLCFGSFFSIVFCFLHFLFLKNVMFVLLFLLLWFVGLVCPSGPPYLGHWKQQLSLGVQECDQKVKMFFFCVKQSSSLFKNVSFGFNFQSPKLYWCILECFNEDGGWSALSESHKMKVYWCSVPSVSSASPPPALRKLFCPMDSLKTEERSPCVPHILNLNHMVGSALMIFGWLA